MTSEWTYCFKNNTFNICTYSLSVYTVCMFNPHNYFSADGSSGFKADTDRYHLYVSLACPWANRTLIVRNLKGLQDVLPYTVVDWFLGEKGWGFTDKVYQLCACRVKMSCKIWYLRHGFWLSQLFKWLQRESEPLTQIATTVANIKITWRLTVLHWSKSCQDVQSKSMLQSPLLVV